MSGRRPNCDSGEPDLWSNGSVFMGPREPISIDPSPQISLQQTTDYFCLHEPYVPLMGRSRRVEVRSGSRLLLRRRGHCVGFSSTLRDALIIHDSEYLSRTPTPCGSTLFMKPG
jgi:hypothetical protein